MSARSTLSALPGSTPPTDRHRDAERRGAVSRRDPEPGPVPVVRPRLQRALESDRRPGLADRRAPRIAPADFGSTRTEPRAPHPGFSACSFSPPPVAAAYGLGSRPAHAETRAATRGQRGTRRARGKRGRRVRRATARPSLPCPAQGRCRAASGEGCGDAPRSGITVAPVAVDRAASSPRGRSGGVTILTMCSTGRPWTWPRHDPWDGEFHGRYRADFVSLERVGGAPSAWVLWQNRWCAGDLVAKSGVHGWERRQAA